MKYRIHDIGVATRIGNYSDAVEVSVERLLFLSGTPGIDANGHVPENFEEQAELAWKNVFALLKKADMGPENLVKVSQYLTNEKHIPSYAPIRAKWLQEFRPASMLLIVPALVWPNLLIEIEVYAVAPTR